jgi:hypothetical protein
MSGRHSGIPVRGRNCSDYRLDRMKSATIADPETGSTPGNLLTAMHSGSSAHCSSRKYDKLICGIDIECTSVVISSKILRYHILWIWRNLTEFNEIVNFVYSVPRYKLDGHWPKRFQINQSVIALHSRLVLRNFVWGK